MGKIYVCSDCGLWSEEPADRCICGCSCITEEEIEEMEEY